MSNDVQLLLTAVDQATRTLLSLRNASESLSVEIEAAQDPWHTFNRQDNAQDEEQSTPFSRVKERYQAGQELVGKASAIGEAGMEMANTNLNAGVALFKPGYDLAQKSAELQAILGVAKASPEMAGLNAQAKQLGDATSLNAADAASAQIIVAQSGADPQGVLAQAPAVLRLSLANQASMEDNAELLIGTKEAFGLADEKAMHIADVITTTQANSHIPLDELTKSLAAVAPAAKNAGVSLEEAAAMVGALHDADISGAGEGSRAVLSRLSAPTEKAQAVLRTLGVKTSDDKGNALPVSAILQALQAGFASHNLSTARRDSYMNTLFGKEGSPAATVLMSAAADGSLEQRTAALNASDGATSQQIAVRENNLGGDLAALQSAYEAIGTNLFGQQESMLRGLVQTATNFVLLLDGWIQRNQGLAQTIGVIATVVTVVAGVIGGVGLVAGPVIAGINGIIAAAGILSGVATTVFGGIVAAIGAVSWPVVAVVAAIAGGALLVRRYWEPISAFFGGVAQDVLAGFAPLGDMFAPLKPVFDWLGAKLQSVWQWFTDLLAPVKASQETLNGCRDIGLKVGEALTAAFSAPLTIVNTLWDKASGILEKLGLVKKESAELDKAVQTAPVQLAAPSGQAAAPAGIALNNVQPVRPQAGNSNADNSTTNLNFYLTASPDQGQQLKQQVIGILQEYERTKSIRNNSSLQY